MSDFPIQVSRGVVEVYLLVPNPISDTPSEFRVGEKKTKFYLNNCSFQTKLYKITIESTNVKIIYFPQNKTIVQSKRLNHQSKVRC